VIKLPNFPVDLSSLFFLSVKHSFVVFKKLFVFIVALVVVKDASIYLGGMPANTYAKAVIALMMVVLLLYLIVSMLSVANRLFTSDKQLTGLQVLVKVIPNFLKSLLVLIGFVLIFVLILLFSHWVSQWLHLEKGDHPVGSLFFVLAVGIFIMLVYVQLFFVIPLLVIKNLPIWGAVKRSNRLAASKENWFRIFAIYVFCLVIWMLISPNTLHGHFMEVHKLSALFDLIVLSITVPILMNLIILTYNDLNLRNSLRIM